jgi:hypothetical protein
MVERATVSIQSANAPEHRDRGKSGRSRRLGGAVDIVNFIRYTEGKKGQQD